MSLILYPVAITKKDDDRISFLSQEDYNKYSNEFSKRCREGNFFSFRGSLPYCRYGLFSSEQEGSRPFFKPLIFGRSAEELGEITNKQFFNVDSFIDFNAKNLAFSKFLYFKVGNDNPFHNYACESFSHQEEKAFFSSWVVQ